MMAEESSSNHGLWTVAWLILAGVTLASGINKLSSDTIWASQIILMAAVFFLNTIKLRLWRSAND